MKLKANNDEEHAKLRYYPQLGEETPAPGI
jgi:hypothetical protein